MHFTLEGKDGEGTALKHSQEIKYVHTIFLQNV